MAPAGTPASHALLVGSVVPRDGKTTRSGFALYYTTFRRRSRCLNVCVPSGIGRAPAHSRLVLCGRSSVRWSPCWIARASSGWCAPRSRSWVTRRTVDDGDSGLLLPPDRGVNLSPFDADAMGKMLASTPARIGVGRAGTRYKTNTLLRFRADHAAAKDAVALRGRREAGGAARPRRADDARARQAHLPRAPRRRTRAQRRGQGARRRQVRQGSAGAGVLRRRAVGGGDQRAPRGVPRRARAGAAGARLSRRHAGVRAPLARQGHGRDRAAGRRRVVRLHLRRASRPRLRRFDVRATTSIARRPAPPTPIARSSSNINPRGLEPTKAAQAVAEACARILAAKKSGVVL